MNEMPENGKKEVMGEASLKVAAWDIALKIFQDNFNPLDYTGIDKDDRIDAMVGIAVVCCEAALQIVGAANKMDWIEEWLETPGLTDIEDK